MSPAIEPGVVAHAYRALADHFEARGLSAPLGVDVRPTHLSVRIASEGAEEWAATLADGTGIRCAAVQHIHHTRLANFETSGLLPDTGVRVSLRWANWALFAPSGRPHPTVPGDLGDLTLAIALETWALEHADDPIPLLPTVHEDCGGCGEALCLCDTACRDLEPDACGHKTRAYCTVCAPAYCRDCRSEASTYDPFERGEWR